MIEKERNKIRILFVYYSSTADKQHPSSLRLIGFRHMLSDMQIPPSITYDLIFQSKSQTFQQFLHKLPKIAQTAFQQSPIQTLISKHMLPLYHYITQHTPFGQCTTAIKHNCFTQQTFLELKSILPQLQCIHSHYFPTPQQNEWATLKKLSFELHLVPQRIPSSLNYLIYLYLSESQSQSAFQHWFTNHDTAQSFNVFTLAMYIILVSHVSRELTPTPHPIKSILDTINLSPTYARLATQHRLALLKTSKGINKSTNTTHKTTSLLTTNTTTAYNPQTTIRINHTEYKVCLDIIHAQDTYLTTIFSHYTVNHLSQPQFIKLCKDMHLHHAIKTQQQHTLLHTFQDHAEGDRMSYEGFKRALIQIAIQQEQFSSSEWLLYMFEKMGASSVGASVWKLKGKKEDPLYPLKKGFKEVYASLVSKLYSMKRYEKQIHIQ